MTGHLQSPTPSGSGGGPLEVEEVVRRIEGRPPDEGKNANILLSGGAPSTTVTTTNGNIDVRNFATYDGGRLQLKTLGGDVELRNVGARDGFVNVMTSSGSVDGEIRNAKEMSVRTKTGDTELDIGSGVKGIDISATSGDVALTLPSPDFTWTGTSKGPREIAKGSVGATGLGKVNTTSGSVQIVVR